MKFEPLALAPFVALLIFAAPSSGAADSTDAVNVELSLKDHVFDPAEISVPAGKVVLLTVKNEDPTPEEFDSHDLKVEKVIAGGSRAVIRLGPLDAGTYSFMGEYNEASAHGLVTAE